MAKNKLTEKLAPAFVILAGLLGGIMVIFVRELSAYGFSSLQITALRFLPGVLFLALFLLIFDRKCFKIKPKDIFIFIILGLFGSLCMSVLYFAAVVEASAAVAAMLLYTAPIWVLIVSVLVYKEPVTRNKIISLVLAFGGCICVSGFSGGKVSVLGIVCGLLSSFSYAAYSLIGKAVMKKYSPLTVTFYSYLFAMIGVWCICDPKSTVMIVSSALSLKLILLISGFGILTMSLLFTAYNLGLSKLPAGKVAIMSLTEPMTATLIGVIVYGETLGILGIAGVLAILIALVILNIDNKEQAFR